MLFKEGDKVSVINPEASVVYNLSGRVLECKEQEPNSSNFYTIKINFGNGQWGKFVLFENELSHARL